MDTVRGIMATNAICIMPAIWKIFLKQDIQIMKFRLASLELSFFLNVQQAQFILVLTKILNQIFPILGVLYTNLLKLYMYPPLVD